MRRVPNGRPRRSPARLLAPVALLLRSAPWPTWSRNSTGSGRRGAATTPPTEPREPRPRQDERQAAAQAHGGQHLHGEGRRHARAIAEKTGVTVEQLQELNPELDPQALVVRPEDQAPRVSARRRSCVALAAPARGGRPRARPGGAGVRAAPERPPPCRRPARRSSSTPATATVMFAKNARRAAVDRQHHEADDRAAHARARAARRGVSGGRLQRRAGRVARSTCAHGERMRVDDLLEALLLESANDAAVTLAEGVSGSRDGVRGRHERARRGSSACDDTSYANPIGLDDPLNYSTASDLAALSRGCCAAALRPRSSTCRSAELESGARPRSVDNRNTLVGRATRVVTGVKTGHTARRGLRAGRLRQGPRRRAG